MVSSRPGMDRVPILRFRMICDYRWASKVNYLKRIPLKPKLIFVQQIPDKEKECLINLRVSYYDAERNHSTRPNIR